MNIDEFLGLTEKNLINFTDKHKIHHQIKEDLDLFFEKAKNDNLELGVISGYRSFQRQKEIWNQKAKGGRPLRDDQGRELELEKLTDEEKLSAILRWSALPGLSRHHWGTDLDIIDYAGLQMWQKKNSIKYHVQLTPEEFSSRGPFHRFSHWQNRENFKFFLPYKLDLGGVAPEPWHFSHKEESSLYFDFALHNKSVLKKLLTSEIYRDLELKDLIQENFDKIFETYFLNINRP